MESISIGVLYFLLFAWIRGWQQI